MKNIRFLITKYSIYVFLFSALFLLERHCLMYFFDIKKITVFHDKMYLYEIVLSLINLLFLWKCIKINPN